MVIRIILVLLGLVIVQFCFAQNFKSFDGIETESIELTQELFDLDKTLIEVEYEPVLDSLIRCFSTNDLIFLKIILIERMDYSGLSQDITSRRAINILSYFAQKGLGNIDSEFEIVRYKNNSNVDLFRKYVSPIVRLELSYSKESNASCVNQRGGHHLDFLKIDSLYNYNPFFELEPAISCSQKIGCPILVIFSGFAVSSVRNLEWDALDNDSIRSLINNHYLVVLLYTDDRTRMVKNEKKTFGDFNYKYQVETTGTNTGPYFAILDCQGNYLNLGLGYDPHIGNSDYFNFLRRGIEKNKCP